MKRTMITILVLLVLALTPLWQSCTPKTNKEKIDQVLKDFYREGAFNGCIVVAEQGKIIADTAMGMADFRTGTALTTESCFYLGSLSKQFTAMGIMLLEQHGALSYDDSLGQYFSSLPAFAQGITIRNLLNHTSGLPDYFESRNLVQPGLTNNDVLYWLHWQKMLDFEPGTKYSYSNTGYLLLSLIIEKASHMSFSQFMRQAIFTPLGMNHTEVLDTSGVVIKNKAAGFNKNKEPDDYNIRTTGDGGIFSTTHDLFTWDQALYKETLISQAALKEAFTKPKLKDGSLSDYGFGWNIREEKNGTAVYHTGELNGYQTFIYRDISHRNTIILLSNQGAALQMWPIADKILSILAR